MKPNKVFLLDDEDYENNHEFSYWAITTSISDHRLAYRLNNALPANFQRARADHSSEWKGNHFEHVTYLWMDEFNDRQWCLLGNNGLSVDRSNALFPQELRRKLAPAQTNADYFLFAMDALSGEEHKEITDAVRKVAGVVMISKYTPSSAERNALNIEQENTLI